MSCTYYFLLSRSMLPLCLLEAILVKLFIWFFWLCLLRFFRSSGNGRRRGFRKINHSHNEFYVDQRVRGIMTATNTVDYSDCREEECSNSQSLKFLLRTDGAEKVHLRKDCINLVYPKCRGAELPTPKVTRQENRPESTV